MKDNNEQLNLEQLEMLANAWMECRLDRNEELALRKVLANSSLHSPLIDECRNSMGLEILLSRTGPHRMFKAGVWLSAAASIALLVVCSLAFSNHLEAKEKVVVYIGGERIVDMKDAHEIVSRNMHETESFKKETIREMSEEQARQHEIIESTFNENPLMP